MSPVFGRQGCLRRGESAVSREIGSAPLFFFLVSSFFHTHFSYFLVWFVIVALFRIQYVWPSSFSVDHTK